MPLSLDAIRLISNELKSINWSQCELECSIGVLGPYGDFTPGVPFKHFSNAAYALNTCMTQTWQSFEPVDLLTCYGEDNRRYRYQRGKETECIMKRKLWTIDIECRGSPYDIRVSLAQEQKVDAVLLEQVSYYRLQKRWVYTDTHSWEYSLTKVSSGSSKDIACKTEPVYEMEVEAKILVTPKNLTSTCQDLIERTIDIMGRYDCYYKPLEIKYKVHHKKTH